MTTWHTIVDTTALALLVVGALLSLTAAIGLLRFPDVLARLHAGTKPGSQRETLDGRVSCMRDARVLTIQGPHHLHVEKPSDLAAAIRTAIARVFAAA